MLNAEIIAIGSEMLTPFRVDTNSLWLTEQLNAIGVEVRLKTIVGDDEGRLEEAIGDALRRSEIVISTGGLGPTEDDVTRQVFARVLKRRLVLHHPTLEKIRARFAKRGIPMPAINERQAMMLEGSMLLKNDHGTAPGMLIEDGGRTAILLPGPPREMKPMYSTLVEPVLRRTVGEMFILRLKLSIFGLSESRVDELAAPIYTRYTNPTTTILVKNGEIELHLTAQAKSESEAKSLLDQLGGKLEEALGDVVYSRKNESLEKVVGDNLRRRGYTVATAESCTGGLLAGRLTEVPGSSHYFNEGVITYSNEAKMARLGVPRELIEAHGAVSEEVAVAMARGIRERTKATFGVGITGIAGPGGGTEAKPVGLVWIGLADDEGAQAIRMVFPGDRHFIRVLAVNTALDMLRRRIF